MVVEGVEPSGTSVSRSRVCRIAPYHQRVTIRIRTGIAGVTVPSAGHCTIVTRKRHRTDSNCRQAGLQAAALTTRPRCLVSEQGQVPPGRTPPTIKTEEARFELAVDDTAHCGLAVRRLKPLGHSSRMEHGGLEPPVPCAGVRSTVGCLPNSANAPSCPPFSSPRKESGEKSARLDSNQRSPPPRGGAISTWLQAEVRQNRFSPVCSRCIRGLFLRKNSNLQHSRSERGGLPLIYAGTTPVIRVLCARFELASRP